MTDPISVDVKGAGELVGLSERRIRDLCNDGKVDSRYEGRKRLVLVDSLRDYIRSLPMERVT